MPIYSGFLALRKTIYLFLSIVNIENNSNSTFGVLVYLLHSCNISKAYNKSSFIDIVMNWKPSSKKVLCFELHDSKLL